MLDRVLAARIRDYAPLDQIEQENVLQEITQHYVLGSLSRSGLFVDAIFHGGTCLRILYGTVRFSEDLDFLLKAPDRDFRWEPHLERVRSDCALEGIELEVQDRSHAERAVRSAFLKTDSIGKIIDLELPFERHRTRKIRIKLEIDTNPPAGSRFETRYLTFPRAAPVTTQTLESGFGTKAHALLCRSYVKGRDWYDFLWYVSRGVVPNLELLANALRQVGPWEGQAVAVSARWFIDAMSAAIRGVDWSKARDDIKRFLPLRDQESLAHWDTPLFLQQLEKLEGYLPV